MSTYVGITIGPIFETIDAATSLTSLWFASTLFSYISETMCKIINEHDGTQVLTPYIEDISTDEKLYGKYPDRIIFTIDDYENMDYLKSWLNTEVIRIAKEKAIEVFEIEGKKDEQKYISEYIQIKYVIVESNGEKQSELYTKINRKLSGLEWMKTFPHSSKYDAIGKLFLESDKSKRNKDILNSNLGKEYNLNRNNLYMNKKNRFRSISEICNRNDKVDKSYKKYEYFAIVYIDADKMGTYLSTLTTFEEMKEFSQFCFKFVEDATRAIRNYDGATIYAGGDDILFLAPVETLDAQGKSITILDLCKSIVEIFHSTFKSYNDKHKEHSYNGSLSFGISVQYEKYPLGEAMKKSRHLLFDVCKSSEDTRNSIALSVQKHSGGTMQLRFSNNQLDHVIDLLSKGLTKDKDGVNSVIRALRYNKKMITLFEKEECMNGNISEEQYLNIWLNFFENTDKEEYMNYYKKLVEFYYKNVLLVKDEVKQFEIFEEKQAHEQIDALLCLLKIKSFLLERVK